MKGHIRQRGSRSFELKFDAGRDPATGNRIIQYQSFKGTKREAQIKLASLIAAVDAGSFVEPSKITIIEFVRQRVDAWQASGAITAKTAQRYRELTENQIVHIGAKPLQKLRPLDIEGWHATLKNSGLAPRTIGHAHRVLSKALKDAVANDMLVKNVATAKPAPKVVDDEMVIVRDVPDLVEKLKTNARLHVLGMVALFSGMRLGEILALRWGRVDLDRNVIQVREAVEHTKAHGLRFKPPKSKAGRRDITMPDLLIETLRDYRKAQLELRMKLGAGKLQDDALLFADLEGTLPSPNSVSAVWSDFAKAIGMPEVSFHGLRHTHASQLISEGVDIVTISKRLGHAKPTITLAIYAHLFQKDDSKAAAAINAALKR
jgi:integrase